MNIKKYNSLSYHGELHLILGPMFSSKTTELLSRYERYTIGGRRCLLVRYSHDKRYDNEKIVTHNKRYNMNALSCVCLYEIDDMIDKYSVICIDEIQFFRDAPIFCNKWANDGRIVVASGLNGTFDMKPWPVISRLLAMAQHVTYKSAVCRQTGGDAHYTQRTISSDKLELIGGEEMYQAVDRSTYYTGAVKTTHTIEQFAEFLDIYADVRGIPLAPAIKNNMLVELNNRIENQDNVISYMNIADGMYKKLINLPKTP